MHFSNCLNFAFPFLANLQNSCHLFNPSVQPGKHHSPAAGEAEQLGEQEEQKRHRVGEHCEDPAAHHTGEERCQQGELRGRGRVCWGPEVEEGLSEGSMQRGRCLGPPGRIPLSWDLVERAVTRQVAVGSMPQGWISLPTGESAHEVQWQLRGAGPDAQQSAGFSSLHIPQILHPKP